MLNGPLQFSFFLFFWVSVFVILFMYVYLCMHVVYLFLMLMITFKCDGLIRFMLDWNKFPNVIKVCQSISCRNRWGNLCQTEGSINAIYLLETISSKRRLWQRSSELRKKIYLISTKLNPFVKNPFRFIVFHLIPRFIRVKLRIISPR